MTQFATFHDLSGRSVFITGGGSGIGAALTDGFLGQGAKVAFVGRSDASVFCHAMEKKHNGNRPYFIACDVTDIAKLKQAIMQAEAYNGTITCLINNAANDSRHSTDEVSEEFWKHSLDVNLKAYFFACQAIINTMRQAGGGSIINFSSISYMMGNVGYPLYTMANAGINGLTRSLAREFGANNIRINTLAPGWVLTDRQKKLWVTKNALAAHLSRQCLPFALAPRDIVDGVLFLASNASKAITGQMLIIDGGVV